MLGLKVKKQWKKVLNIKMFFFCVACALKGEITEWSLKWPISI